MKKNKIFIFVFLLLFNYFGIVYASFNISNNDNSLIVNSMASSKKDNINKSFFASLSQNSGFELSRNIFDSTYNKFISSLDEVKKSSFYNTAREYTIRKLFKGKESYEKLVLENVLQNDEDWQRAFKGNMDSVFGFLNKAYYDYASQDKVEFKGNYQNFHFEIVDHYTKDFYFNSLTYTKTSSEFISTSNFNDGDLLFDEIILRGDGNFQLENGKLPKDFRAKQVFLKYSPPVNNYKLVHCDYKEDFYFRKLDAWYKIDLNKRLYGFSFKDKVTYENLLIHGYKEDDFGNVILDGYCIVVLEKPSYSFDIKKTFNRGSVIEAIKSCIEFQGNSSVPYKNLTGIKKVINKSYEYTINSPIYNHYIDNSKITKYIGDNITYNIYNDGDLSSSIDSILSYIDSSDDYLSEYMDYLYNGNIKPQLDEIMLAIDENNNIAVDNKEIISKIDELKVDYNKIDEIVKNYTDKLYTKFIDDVNTNLNDLNIKISNIDKEIQVVKQNDLNYYNEIKLSLESLNNDFNSFKNSFDDLGSCGNSIDYSNDFKSLNEKFDDLKNDYNSKFDTLNNKIDKLSVSNIVYTDEEKGKLKDNIFGFFDFFDKLKNFFKGFFDVTESIDFSPIKNIDVKEKFPFSLPFDIANIFKNLTSVPKVPKYDFKFLGQDLSINFSRFESLAKIVRSFSFLFFIVFLAIKTYDKFGG